MWRWGGAELCVSACACVCLMERLRAREVREGLCSPHLLPSSLSFQLQPEPPELAAPALQFSST